jgi:hypothetical protein
MTPTINIMDRVDENKWGALAKIEGPAMFGGCSELCCSSPFTVSQMKASQLGTALKSSDMAHILKQKPRDLNSALTELVSDSDVYTMQFNPHARLAPQQKATMLASLILVDYMFFERDDPACSLSGGIGCHLCSLYCCGCIFPVCLKIPQSGGSQGGSGGGGFAAD